MKDPFLADPELSLCRNQCWQSGCGGRGRAARGIPGGETGRKGELEKKGVQGGDRDVGE